MIGLATIILGIGRTFFDAYVLWQLWGWFAVPAGMHPVGYWVAYGLDQFIAFASVTFYQAPPEAPSIEKTLGALFGKGVCYLLILGIGYLAHRMAGGA